jgi:hypothetical protein
MITVIATGFENRREAAARPAPGRGWERHPRDIQRPETRVDYDQPAFVRGKSVSFKKVANGDFAVIDTDLDGEDLDVPTFMRKQAD